jgi:hypothetical protein
MAEETIDVWGVLTALLQQPDSAASRDALTTALPGDGLEDAIADGVKRGFLADHGTRIRVTPDGVQAHDSQLFG